MTISPATLSSSDKDNTLVSINQIVDDLKGRGIQINSAHEAMNTLSYLASAGIVPFSISKFNSNERGVVDHFPKWVVDVVQKVDELERQGVSRDKAISMMLHQELEKTPKTELDKIRRQGGFVGGATALQESRRNVRNTLSFGGNMSRSFELIVFVAIGLLVSLWIIQSVGLYTPSFQSLVASVFGW